MTNEQTNNEQTQTIENESDWLQQELDQVETHKGFEELPSMKFEEKVITEITIDFSAPFERWDGEQNGKPITKKIIPVLHNEESKNWWLNVRNPVYKEILKAGAEGTKTFKILQTGTQANTRYTIVK